jgi:hypothetical protein
MSITGQVFRCINALRGPAGIVMDLPLDWDDIWEQTVPRDPLYAK